MVGGSKFESLLFCTVVYVSMIVRSMQFEYWTAEGKVRVMVEYGSNRDVEIVLVVVVVGFSIRTVYTKILLKKLLYSYKYVVNHDLSLVYYSGRSFPLKSERDWAFIVLLVLVGSITITVQEGSLLVATS